MKGHTVPENTTTPNLGVIVRNPKARRVVYGAYAVAAFIVGGTAAYFLGIGEQLPTVVVGAQAVIAYAGIPIGALAVANTTPGS